ncbi:hypothetical protein V1511DRAFT_519847 [Dipodascopsis uninucleata]
MVSSKRRVGYAYHPSYTAITDGLPSNIGRSSLVDSLISAYDLLGECEAIISPSFASFEQLTVFHGKKFVRYLLESGEGSESEDNNLSASSSDDDDQENQCETRFENKERLLQERYGLEYDCPKFDLMAKYVRAVAGTTIASARFIAKTNNDPRQSIAINWHGGRHHAGKEKCSGFCYVNDIVLGIIELRRVFDKVLYIDLDVHHGDGVEAAFAHSNRVMCVSLHRYDAGFFPGTGQLQYIGKGRGQYYTLNLPMKSGLCDSTLKTIVGDIIYPIFQKFGPNAVVVQCGADGLARDPTNQWNLSPSGLSDAILEIVSWRKPCLLLGGGGYNHADTSRTWCYTLGRLLDIDTKPLDEFAKDQYQFFVDDSIRRMPDENLKNGYLEEIKCHAHKIFHNIL